MFKRYKQTTFVCESSHTQNIHPSHMTMQTSNSTRKEKGVKVSQIESLPPALNEVSRAKGNPVTNGTFHILGWGRGIACHLKLIELSHAKKTLVINPPHLN